MLKASWARKSMKANVTPIHVLISSLSFNLFSIEGVVEAWGLNETFVGLIILPIVGK